MNTATDSRTVMSSVIFSPDSGGKMKPSSAMDDIRIHGNSRLRT